MPAATAALSAILLVLTACVPAPDVVVPVEPTGAQPVFASDEEALAAAVAAFEEYQSVAYGLYLAGSPDFETLQGLVTDEWFQQEVRSAEEFESDGLTIDGGATTIESRLQQWWEEPAGVAHVVVYICEDISATRIIDARGKDVTPVDRDDTVPIEVVLVSSSLDLNSLLISEVRPWAASGFC